MDDDARMTGAKVRRPLFRGGKRRKKNEEEKGEEE